MMPQAKQANEQNEKQGNVSNGHGDEYNCTICVLVNHTGELGRYPCRPQLPIIYDENHE